MTNEPKLKPKKEYVEHQEDGECGCKYLEEDYPCQIEAEAKNDMWDKMEAYHNAEQQKWKEKLDKVCETLDYAIDTLQKERAYHNAVIARDYVRKNEFNKEKWLKELMGRDGD